LPTRTVGARAGVATTLAAGMLLASVPAAAEPAPVPSSADPIEHIVQNMTVDQLIGQMTWTHVYGNTVDHAGHVGDGGSNQSRYGVDTPAEVVEKYELGGVLYFAWSNPVVTNDPVGTAELSNDLQRVSVERGSGIPLAVTIDQEGGIVARMGAPATVFPGNMALGATHDTHLGYAQGQILGAELAAVGVNANFAPVVDVNTNPANPVIGVRSMGEDPALVASMGQAQIEGMQENGVAAAAKHFPGHGNTDTDSHTGLPIVTYDRETLDQHLLPFQQAIDGGVDMIMTAHVILEAVDPDMPGTLSKEVLTDLLREEMGFDGLITTDALNMAALKQLPGNPLDDGDIAVLAVQAGSDILLMSPDVDATFEAINEAVADGEITRERLEESVTRILEWKVERGVWADPLVDVDAVEDVVGREEHRATAQEIADRSVTLLRNEDGLLPLDDGRSVLVTGWGQTGVPALAAALTDHGADATHLYTANFPTAEQIAAAAEEAQEHETVLVMTHTPANAEQTAAQQDLLDALVATGTPVIQVPVRNPYDVAWAEPAAQLATYGYQRPSLEALARVVMGDAEPAGRLPVNVPTADGEDVLFPLGFGLSYPQAPAERYGFFLSDDWSGQAHHVFQYGRHTDEVLIGDWDGDGTDTIVVRRGTVYHVSNAPRGGPADYAFHYGRPDDVVLVGDWDGDGTDTLAVRRGKTYHVKNSLTGGDADHVVRYGRTDDEVMVGDWDGDGRETFAVRRGATYHVKNSLRGGDADVTFTYGRADDHVLTGDWDGDGEDTFAVQRGRTFHVSNALRGGPADFSLVYGREGDEVYGREGDEVEVGDWNGDGRDTLGIRRLPPA